MGAAEGQMVRADLVQEIVARRERGESTRQIARESAVDRKTVRRWLRIGGWQPRQGGERRRAIDPYIEFVDQRGPEVGWNGVVLHRELMALGFSGSYQQVQRLLKPRRDRRRRQEAATVRSRLSRANRRRSTTASSRSGSESIRRRSTCSCIRWTIRGVCLPAGIATSGWPRCSTATSARFATLAA
jgi:hypothetical protein